MKVWQYKELEQGNEVEAYISDSDGEIVAQFWAVDAKDGRLMAAAPRLTEALKELLDSIDTGDNDARLLTAKAEARAALREAGIE